MIEKEWIDKEEAKKYWPDNHDQPERSKREDSLICEQARNELRKFLDESFDERINYCHQKELERCGALNTMET